MVDKPSYAKATRIIRLYKDTPQVQELITRFNLQKAQSRKGRGFKQSLPEVISYLEEVLEKYNCIPSQKVDRAAYAKTTRLLKLYKDELAIQQLIAKYKIKIESRNKSKSCLNIDDIIIKLRNILEKHNGMPAQRIACNDYQFARRYIKMYKHVPEIQELIYRYNIVFRRTPEQAYNYKSKLVKAILEKRGRCPIDDKSERREWWIVKNFFWRYKDDEFAKLLKYKYVHHYAWTEIHEVLREKQLLSHIRQYGRWGINAAYTIIVYNNFNILPIFINVIHNQALEFEKNQDILVFKRFREIDIKIKNLLILSLYELGCREELIINTYDIFVNPSTQIIINNLNCENPDDFLSDLLDIRL